jgi:cobalt/nickel transport system permease protein
MIPNNVFNTYFAQQKNILTQIDARIKLILVIVSLILIICLKSISIPLITTVVCICCLILIAKIPVHIILIRLSAPLGIACIILVIHTLFYGTEPIVKFNIAGWHITVFKDGIYHGLMIISKILGAVSLIMFLTMTTSVHDLLYAGLWLRIPYTFIEITMLAYRYVFVLLHTMCTVRDAQVVRLGYTNWHRGLHSWGELAGIAVIKAYNQTISTYEAMLSRGYSSGKKIKGDVFRF